MYTEVLITHSLNSGHTDFNKGSFAIVKQVPLITQIFFPVSKIFSTIQALQQAAKGGGGVPIAEGI